MIGRRSSRSRIYPYPRCFGQLTTDCGDWCLRASAWWGGWYTGRVLGCPVALACWSRCGSKLARSLAYASRRHGGARCDPVVYPKWHIPARLLAHTLLLVGSLRNLVVGDVIGPSAQRRRKVRLEYRAVSMESGCCVCPPPFTRACCGNLGSRTRSHGCCRLEGGST